MLTKMMQEYYKKPVILLMDEYFGFTGNDVKRLLQSADLEKYGERIQSWYDGYHFGDVDVYCPWDVMNYVRDLQFDPDARPVSYWKIPAATVLSGRLLILQETVLPENWRL